MAISKKNITPKYDNKIEGRTDNRVNKFKYLVIIIRSGGRYLSETKSRIGQVKAAFHMMESIVSNKSFVLNALKKLLKCCIGHVLPYGSKS